MYLSEDFDSVRKRIGDTKKLEYMDTEEYLMYCYLGTEIQEAYVQSYVQELKLQILATTNETTIFE